MLEFDFWLVWTVLVKFGIYLTSLFAVGSLLILWLLKPLPNAITSQIMRFVLICALLATNFTLGRILLQAGQLYDDGWVGLIDKDMILLVTGGPLGTSSFVRIIGLAALVIAVLKPILRVAMTILGAILVALSFSFVGHATQNQMILGALLTIHLLAVSYWLGALFPIYQMAKASEYDQQTGESAHAFGQQAIIIVPILIALGMAFAIFLVGSPVLLFGSTYGLVLSGKVMIVGLLLGLAGLNKFRFVPKLLLGDPQASHDLAKSIQLESVAFVFIFLITAILTSAVNLPAQ